ncbi:hypothetical protein ACS15_4351 [Ralstonia insidiosa]|uniref:Uncharacterized protein n=1 Tax=Ralstonia insidiosa TaxID=190721 RepID=A0AAC9BKF8_9RALS|nr:hypothetical protein ACS15_4351 [Ralstonia insidiosa]
MIYGFVLHQSPPGCGQRWACSTCLASFLVASLRSEVCAEIVRTD